MKKKQVLSEKA